MKKMTINNQQRIEALVINAKGESYYCDPGTYCRYPLRKYYIRWVDSRTGEVVTFDSNVTTGGMVLAMSGHHTRGVYTFSAKGELGPVVEGMMSDPEHTVFQGVMLVAVELLHGPMGVWFIESADQGYKNVSLWNDGYSEEEFGEKLTLITKAFTKKVSSVAKNRIGVEESLPTKQEVAHP